MSKYQRDDEHENDEEKEQDEDGLDDDDDDEEDEGKHPEWIAQKKKVAFVLSKLECQSFSLLHPYSRPPFPHFSYFSLAFDLISSLCFDSIDARSVLKSLVDRGSKEKEPKKTANKSSA
jgi:hypothetical protein